MVDLGGVRRLLTNVWGFSPKAVRDAQIIEASRAEKCSRNQNPRS